MRRVREWCREPPTKTLLCVGLERGVGEAHWAAHKSLCGGALQFTVIRLLSAAL